MRLTSFSLPPSHFRASGGGGPSIYGANDVFRLWRDSILDWAAERYESLLRCVKMRGIREEVGIKKEE